MAKKKKTFLDKYANIIGWCGAAATLSAYFLISFGIFDAKDLQYQLLNIAGAIGLGTVCFYKRTYQPLVVNIIWGAIALLAIINIVLFLS